ncbi:hypothetical protein J2Y45_006815 [Dyadobacter sp. BE34]|jgi:hypothetical protein|uniref:Uncharacterized protein n=1 Tax=Dyadobacter fermentans TaxID=94254 RepID=A0ABU1R8G2_9BACT|nr:hypothetical protein [Dyadobacter fermentans]MDR7047481.1 hypothetical protein [Dyadobacter sp. BE242]MDR7201651.1 hypothetical protein [Dyadobacter sp. BE34]MDR7219521.1 hypothetical protein [Dyadobacter sp. BE31]MDR7267289.1 hypothetical protein [Dyadobacter sp. BE32]
MPQDYDLINFLEQGLKNVAPLAENCMRHL